MGCLLQFSNPCLSPFKIPDACGLPHIHPDGEVHGYFFIKHYTLFSNCIIYNTRMGHTPHSPFDDEFLRQTTTHIYIYILIHIYLTNIININNYLTVYWKTIYIFFFRLWLCLKVFFGNEWKIRYFIKQQPLYFSVAVSSRPDSRYPPSDIWIWLESSGPHKSVGGYQDINLRRVLFKSHPPRVRGWNDLGHKYSPDQKKIKTNVKLIGIGHPKNLYRWRFFSIFLFRWWAVVVSGNRVHTSKGGGSGGSGRKDYEVDGRKD